MIKMKLGLIKKSDHSSRDNITVNHSIFVSHTVKGSKKRTNAKLDNGQNKTNMYTFSSIFPNEDIMKRAQKVIRQAKDSE